MNATRHLSPLDRAIAGLDTALRFVFGPTPAAQRSSPAPALPQPPLSDTARELAGRLMRVNHAGEICAQALYQGQALAARKKTVREKMERASAEENDHLNWTAVRLEELGAHPSYLNAVWYSGSFAIGAIAGLLGDRWSLGFVAETERQVVAHLDRHLALLPPEDLKSRAILEQMRHDEGQHATTALESGAVELPESVRRIMQVTSGIMTRAAYWI